MNNRLRKQTWSNCKLYSVRRMKSNPSALTEKSNEQREESVLKLDRVLNMIVKKKTTENRELRGEQVWTLEQISCSMAVITTRNSG